MMPEEAIPAATRTLSHLPIGLAYALFAPFPLFARRLQEFIAAPEMILWYALLVAALATVLRERRRWIALIPAIVTFCGLLTVLALAEGNVGTLFRHRGMLVPLVALLAGPTLARVFARSRVHRSGSPIAVEELALGHSNTDTVPVRDIRGDPHIT